MAMVWSLTWEAPPAGTYEGAGLPSSAEKQNYAIRPSDYMLKPQQQEYHHHVPTSSHGYLQPGNSRSHSNAGPDGVPAVPAPATAPQTHTQGGPTGVYSSGHIIANGNVVGMAEGNNSFSGPIPMASFSNQRIPSFHSSLHDLNGQDKGSQNSSPATAATNWTVNGLSHQPNGQAGHPEGFLKKSLSRNSMPTCS